MSRSESPGTPVPLEMDSAESWRMLGSTALCRLAFDGPDGAPDIRPVNHLVVDDAVYIRSAFDAKVVAIAAHSYVAVEVDGEDDQGYWSVVVRGVAAQVTSEAELRRVGVERFASWTATPKPFVLKVDARSVTGRRFPKNPRIAPPVYAVPLTDEAAAEHQTQRGERPSPIPHFAPPAAD